ncbi:MAG TPA: hypothetical protein VF581_10425 [Flavobacterium sp.]|jgi:hypothetical protein
MKQDNQPRMSRADRLLLQTMKDRKEKKGTPQYLNENHTTNSEAAMRQIAASKTRIIDWDSEAERQKRNSTDC